MNKELRNAGKKIDIYFLMILAFSYVFANIIFFWAGAEDVAFVVLLNIMFILAVVAYFSSAIFSLSACLFFVFAYGSYVLYASLYLKLPVDMMDYLWVALIPIHSIIVTFYKRYLSEIQKQVTYLNKLSDTTLGFDEHTNLLNERMFYHDLSRFMSMARRGHIKLCLMNIKLKFYDDIKKLIGEAAMDGLLRDIGEKINQLTRNEDLQFFTDKKGGYSLIMITDLEGANLVRRRIKRDIQETGIKERMKLFSLNLDLMVGIAEYDEGIKNSLEFKERAQKDMEYDV